MEHRSPPVLAPLATPNPPPAGVTQTLLETTDWSGTALGPVAGWPPCLRSALGIAMHARQPMAVVWGTALHILYNDSYRAILGARAEPPAATFGQPVTALWPELADVIVPVLHRAFDGQADFAEDMPFAVTRNGVAETLFLSVSTSPIADGDGIVRGVFCTFADTTARVETRRERDAALASLATLGERLRLATEIADLGTFDHDLKQDTVTWSEQTRRHFGVAPDAPVAKELFAAALHPDDRVRVHAQVAAFYAAPGDGRWAADYRTIGLDDGRERWLSARGQLFWDEAGKPVRLLGTTLDITARKRAEAQARQFAQDALATADANAKFRTFFAQGSHVAMLLSRAGIVLEANRITLEGSGYRRDQVEGQLLWACPWWAGAPASRETLQDAVRQALAGQVAHTQLPYVVASGEERVGQLTIAPVCDDAGRVLYLAATGTDVTEREAVAARLRLLDAIGEATRVAVAPDAIMEVATRMLGQYMDVTRVAYADLEADNDRFTIRHDWTAPGASSTVGVYSLDLFGERAKASMRTGHTLLIEDVDHELTAQDGADMFNLIGVKAIICCPLVKGGQLLAMMAVHQDSPRRWSTGEVALVEAVVERCWAHIERVRAMAALRETDQRKSEFLAVLAHELRNPLAPIRNGIDMLRISAGNPAAAAKVRDMMERQVNHMVHLINDLLDVARVNNGKVVLQPEPVELRQVLANAVEASAAAIDAAGHAIDVAMPPAPLWFDADPVRLAQVLGNLLSNAVKYTPPGGQLHLSGQCVDGMIELRLRDSGIGIAPEHLASVFDMFTQVSRNLEQARGGLGIGLSLVQRLVALHDGTVSVASAGPGQGSTFTVRLPARLRAAPLAPAGVVPALAPAPAGPLRILVADDNVDAADTMRALLEAGGYAVRIAYDGAEALAIAAAFLPQIALLDLGMPRMDGFEAARRMRALPALHGMVLVAVTGWGAESDRADSRAAGFDHHLLKPASLQQVQELVATVARAL
jgi:PAS domain S-box-containing protein